MKFMKMITIYKVDKIDKKNTILKSKEIHVIFLELRVNTNFKYF